MNKQRLYWTMQIGGWLLYATVQMVSSIIVSGEVSANRLVFLFVESMLPLVVTHVARLVLKPGAWLNIGVPRLIMRVVLTALVLGFVFYFLRLPVGYLLGMYDSELAFDPGFIVG